MQRWQELHENIEAQLDNMGIDFITKKQEAQKFDGVKSVFLLGVYLASSKLPEKLQNLWQSMQSKEKQEYEKGLNDLKEMFNDYIDTIIECSAN